MKKKKIQIKWPNGQVTYANTGDNWLDLSINSGVSIPTGCLGGSCGACEIEANGKVYRACIDSVPDTKSELIEVDFYCDPYW